MKYDIFEIYTKEIPVYVVTPRKGIFKTFAFLPMLLRLDFEQDPSLGKILKTLYKKGFYFIPDDQRAVSDTEAYNEKLITKQYSEVPFKTRKYNPSIGRIGFNKNKLEKLYGIKKDKYGLYV